MRLVPGITQMLAARNALVDDTSPFACDHQWSEWRSMLASFSLSEVRHCVLCLTVEARSLIDKTPIPISEIAR